MTRADTARLMAIIVMAYPNFDKFRDNEHIKGMTNVWAEMFSDDDSGLVGMAVKQHISQSRFPPSIAEIREIMASIKNPDLISPGEAWGAVSKLLYTHGEHYHGDLHNELPRPIADAVEAVGYSNLYALHAAPARGQTQKAGLDRVAFMQVYEPIYAERKRAAIMPNELQNNINAAKRAFENGERKMLQGVDNNYRRKKESYERLYTNLTDIELLDSTEIALLEEKQEDI